MESRRATAAGGSSLWTIVKWGFLAMLLGSALTAVVLIMQAGDARHLQKLAGPAAKSEQAHVDKPLIIERKAGKMVWRLKASKAEQELRGKMHLIAPELELFSEDGKVIPVTGREAWFNPLTKAISFQGNVVARYGEWTLYSQHVDYDHASDSLHIPGDFRIEGKLTRARGRNMTAYRHDHHVRVEEGAWIEDRHPNAVQVGR